MVVEKNKEDKAFSSRDVLLQERTRRYSILPPFPCGVEIVDQGQLYPLVRNGVLFFYNKLERFEVVSIPQKERVHVQQCFSFRKIFNEKNKVEEILLKEGALNINDLHPKTQ